MSAPEEDPGREAEGAALTSPPPAEGKPPPSALDEGEADGRSGEAGEPSPAEGQRSDGDGQSESRESEREGSEAEGSRAETEAPSSSSPGAPSRLEAARSNPADTFHLVKWIVWKGEQTPLITQSENGPCPLIALINVLLLRWKVKLPPKTEIISVEQLMTLLGDSILSAKPREDKQGLQLNFEQNMSDAMSVLPKLSTGLDVNVRFTGVGDFEYTPECIIFDMLDIPLYHGWLIDPQSCETIHAVGRCSYNQLVEKIISSKHSSDSALVSEGLVAEQFLDATATQLTYHGLCELTSAAKEDELCVFFRNNHFSTLIKHKGHLYLLVTDQGFLSEQKVVWESLHNVEGDGNFCDSEFCLSHPSGRQVPFTIAHGPQEQINQVKLPPKTEIISVEQPMTLLGDSILSAKPREDKQGLQLNFEQSCETIHAVGRCSCPQLVKKIISSKHPSASVLVSEGLHGGPVPPAGTGSGGDERRGTGHETAGGRGQTDVTAPPGTGNPAAGTPHATGRERPPPRGGRTEVAPGGEDGQGLRHLVSRHLVSRHLGS